MILQVHSDTSYMNDAKACSTASGHYFLGNNIKSGKPIVLNGAIHTLCKTTGVAASAAEAELGSLFLNTKETVKLRIEFKELEHTQPPTHIHTDNTITMGIIHNKLNKSNSAQ